MKARLVTSPSITGIDKALHFLIAALALLIVSPSALPAQVYSPKVLVEGQADSSSLEAFANGIFRNAGAVTPREKAEAIWRFFLTDARFVPPGFWYHIAGWAYEEPSGEVLDPLKLLNSYGFGLCYQLAPLLEAVWEAGGFPDARVWFLTGHTVAEVYYDGAYHHFDSDLMGYNLEGEGDPTGQPVASVLALARNPRIFLDKLTSPKSVDPSRVSRPWYPADLREGLMGEVAGLFSSTTDNWLFPFRRFPAGHSMGFVLRPGEQLVRYFQPERKDLYYLPYALDEKGWREFPSEVNEYSIRTEDGPRSQKDQRSWATGRLVYEPVLSDRSAYWFLSENLKLPVSAHDPLRPQEANKPALAVFEVISPWVIIDAGFSTDASLGDQDVLTIETSPDGGRQWHLGGRLSGPYQGEWKAEPAVLVRTAHGRLTAVSGQYRYLVRLTMEDRGQPGDAYIERVVLDTALQVNPRSLPALKAGQNRLTCHTGQQESTRPVPVDLADVQKSAFRVTGIQSHAENKQALLFPDHGSMGEVVFELAGPGGRVLSGFAAGGRFLDLSDGWAPDKLTAEIRRTTIGQRNAGIPAGASGSLAWSLAPDGPYTVLWQHPCPSSKETETIDQTLRWPEVDESVTRLPEGTSRVYVRYQLGAMGLDNVRLSITSKTEQASELLVTHQWFEDGALRSFVQRVNGTGVAQPYEIAISSGREIVNQAIILTCPRSAK